MKDIRSKRYGAAVDVDAVKKALQYPEHGTGALLVAMVEIMNEQRKHVDSLEARLRDLERAKRHSGGPK